MYWMPENCARGYSRRCHCWLRHIWQRHRLSVVQRIVGDKSWSAHDRPVVSERRTVLGVAIELEVKNEERRWRRAAQRIERIAPRGDFISVTDAIIVGIVVPLIDRIAFDNGRRIVALDVEGKRRPYRTRDGRFYLRIGAEKRETTPRRAFRRSWTKRARWDMRNFGNWRRHRRHR